MLHYLSISPKCKVLYNSSYELLLCESVLCSAAGPLNWKYQSVPACCWRLIISKFLCLACVTARKGMSMLLYLCYIKVKNVPLPTKKLSDTTRSCDKSLPWSRNEMQQQKCKSKEKKLFSHWIMTILNVFIRWSFFNFANIR